MSGPDERIVPLVGSDEVSNEPGAALFLEQLLPMQHLSLEVQLMRWCASYPALPSFQGAS